jgi:hypothetical protein
MSKPRKQHFVPQFYLRNFSLDENKIGISSYNHKTEKFFIDVPIKSQAYKEYMYGKDGLIEKDLSLFESKIATLISDPQNKILPPSNLEDFNLLREFILVQHSRTVKAGAEALAALNNAFTAIRPYLKNPNKIPKDLKISHEYPSVLSLYRALDHSYLMGHLMMKSIVNMSTLSFITSDNPIATYNIWMEQQGFYAGATALAVKGLLIFLPIAPRLMYCFYDPYVYEIGDPDQGFVETQSETDVHQLNGLQYLSSDSQLFFSEKILPPEYIEDLVKGGKHLRVSESAFSRVFQTKNDSGKESLYLFNSFEDSHFGLSLPFIQLTETGRNSKLSNGLPEVRHPSFIELRNNIKATPNK